MPNNAVMLKNMSKHEELRALGEERKRTRWPGYNCIGDYHQQAYECDHVSPYTKTAGNVESAIFILLQDWSSHSWLSKPLNEDVQRLGYAPNLPTNKNLEALLHEHFNVTLADVYATNLFPFVKNESMSGKIPHQDLLRAARCFALPQIEIVRPAIVVCMGLATFNAMRVSCGQAGCNSMSSAIESEFAWGAVNFWAQVHPGHFGMLNRNRGNANRARNDWQRMKSAFDRRAF